MERAFLAAKTRAPSGIRHTVPRPRVVARLDDGLTRDLILISAPPGFGKTTAISAWLRQRTTPSAWVSLDADDDQVDVFMDYVTAAIESAYPGACRRTRSMLQVSPLPPTDVIAERFSCELDELPGELVLVLDDYHHVRDMAVHEVLAKILQHPPSGVHLAVVTRHDPPLPLATLRARGRVAELRRTDLRFDADETRHLFRLAVDHELSGSSLAALEEQLEGWPVGLHLLARTMHRDAGPDALLHALRVSMRPAVDYLVSEVLSALPREMQRTLIETSVTDSFCAPLVDALCADPVQPTGLPEADAQPMDGGAFIARLGAEDLFVTPLGDSGRWFRYHNVLLTILRQHLTTQYRTAERADLHHRAIKWFSENRLAGQALHHAAAIEDWECADEIVSQARVEAINREDWPRLRRWLDVLPQDVVDRSPGLLVAQAFVLQNDQQLAKVDEVVDQAEALANRNGVWLADEEHRVLGSEIAILRANSCFWRGEYEDCAHEAQQVLALAPDRLHVIRGVAHLYHGLSRQMSGKTTESREMLQQALEAGAYMPVAYRSRFLLGLAIVDLTSADLESALRHCRQHHALSAEHGLYASLNWSRFVSANASYLRNDTSTALDEFAAIVDQPYGAHPLAELHSHFGLAATHLAAGRRAVAAQWADRATAWALERNVPGALDHAESFHARLDLEAGRIARAVAWTERRPRPHPVWPIWLPEIPAITRVQALIASGSDAQLDEAEEVLAEVRRFVESTHTTVRQIDVLVLEALLRSARGAREAALDALEQAVALAEPASIVRPFLDLRPSPLPLLRALADRPAARANVRGILATSNGGPSMVSASMPPAGLPSETLLDPLTPRELEVLALLAERLSNDEIAARMMVSRATVKTHAHNIYGKLDVHDRREAVARAHSLGMLADA